VLDARPVEGRFRSARWWVTGVLIAILLGIPWVRIAGEPLVLIDIAARRFHFGPLVIFPQELYFLWLLIIGLAIALFFFTSLAGRLWCGWACPQTVFTDLFAWIARRIEGWQGHSRPSHVAVWRKLLLHATWLLLCAGIAFHLVGYFRSPYVMVSEIAAGTPTRTTLVLWTVVTLLAYVDFAIVRQTFCKYLCPYARFQGVMFDRDTLVIGYDTARGEPRGKRAGAGDCVDCGLCVQVCPTGIDIRKGLQLECIACTQCIDACDGVMAKLGREPSLIGYRSLISLEEGTRARLLRPRVLVYGALLCIVIGAFATLLVSRKLIDMQVVHNRTELYHTAADGRTTNSYTLYIQNREGRERTFRVRVEAGESNDDFELVAGMNPVRVPASDDLEARVFVLASPDAAVGPEGRDLDFVIESVDDARARVVRRARFLAPRSS
jgi:cytochrome c oxidase accessory protein FixG